MPVLAQNFVTLGNDASAAHSSWSAERSALVADALRRSGQLHVRLRVYGESMLPALWPGDVVEIESCSLEDVWPGEIVLARREGRLFLHRFVAFCPPNGFLLRGDSMPGLDPQYPHESLLGRLVRRIQCPPALQRASDFDEVAVSLKQDPDTKRYSDTKRGFAAACTAALRLDFGARWLGVKWSRALGMVFCHCGVARRLALKLHSHGKGAARELQNVEHGEDFGAL